MDCYNPNQVHGQYYYTNRIMVWAKFQEVLKSELSDIKFYSKAMCENDRYSESGQFCMIWQKQRKLLRRFDLIR